jgi:hypothetical protein
MKKHEFCEFRMILYRLTLYVAVRKAKNAVVTERERAIWARAHASLSDSSTTTETAQIHNKSSLPPNRMATEHKTANNYC